MQSFNFKRFANLMRWTIVFSPVCKLSTIAELVITKMFNLRYTYYENI